MIPQQDLLISTKRFYKKIKEYIDNYRNNIETKDVHYYNLLLENINNIGFFNNYCSSEKVCMHIYNNGNKAGNICGAKVFIKTNNKFQKYLCSRHCRDYNTKCRKYNNRNRCKYIRNNGSQCKHYSIKNQLFCYIHKAEENIEYNIEMEKQCILNKLEKRRKKYFLVKYNKNKHNNKNIIIKYNRFLKNIEFFEFYKFSKSFNKYDKYNYYNKIKFK